MDRFEPKIFPSGGISVGARSILMSLLVIGSLKSAPAMAQTLPQDFDYSRYSEMAIDAGYLWSINSVFHPLRPIDTERLLTFGESKGNNSAAWILERLIRFSRDSEHIIDKSEHRLSGLFLGSIALKDETGDAARFEETAFSTSLWANLRFHRNWYARLAVRSTNAAASLPHFSGVSRSISRAGFSASEVDQSALGFENGWATVEYGRTREIWGPMAEDNLIPAGSSPAWEQIKLEGRYKRLTYRYFFGFLESIEVRESSQMFQRYIVGRGVEYRNGRNLVLGVTELSILAGDNRPPDWAFLNPIGIELEIEQNHRANSRANSSQANSVWTTHIDWLATPSLRVAGSLLIDEFQLDQDDRDKGRTDLTGILCHIAWTPVRTRLTLTTLFDYARIGSYTMMHNTPYTVFSTRSQFIGNSIGNDAEKIEIGCRCILTFPLVVEAGAGFRRWGDLSLLKNPYGFYDNILKTRFPSGRVRHNDYLRLKADYLPGDHVSIGLETIIDLKNYGPDSRLGVVMVTARLQSGLIAKAF